VVEAMYSFEQLLSIGGNAHWGDEIEKLAYNALPATISADMWTHQYDQMTNQIRCERLPEDHVVFGTNGPESHLFGLEPNFGCCTANFNQGWPKFAMSTFMKSEKGLASCLITPSEVAFEFDGANISCKLDTEYPFRNTARYTLTTDKPVRMELLLRIPACAKSATVNGKPATPGEFYAIDQQWIGKAEILVAFEFKVELVERPRDMRALWYGPMLYSVAIDERWEKLEYEAKGVERKFPYCDYEIFPESPWNYGFAGDCFKVSEKPIGEYPFCAKDAPVEITASLSPIDWPEEYGVCAVTPTSRKALGEARDVRMIPYGTTTLRMTEMPVVEK
jgi:hypothetical protein